jgi:predicted AAA+ superfamily ATPase
MTFHVDRFLTLPENESVFLFGPRGTGKSTWLRKHLPHALYIDLLDPSLARRLSARPEYLEELANGFGPGTIVIDEVQKIPELLEVVHRLMETSPGRRFVLTGSSARKLKRTGADMLAGRALIRHCWPFTAAELKERFNLEEALQSGTIPVVFASADKKEASASYLFTYIEQEVKHEGLVRNIGHFHRFLEVLSFSHGALLNTSDIARESAVPRKTVESYISVVEDLLLGYRLPVFSRRAKRHLISQNKFYFIDQGVFNGLRPRGLLDSSSEIGGAALEGLVFQHLKTWIDYFRMDLSLHFWRTRSGSEVDFILYGEDGFHAIEVKNGTAVRNKDLSALKAFLKDYPEAGGTLVYRGDVPLEVDGIRCVPCRSFLLSLSGKDAMRRGSPMVRPPGT